ncbi:MAG TPA: hypothetical protein VGG28_12300 [Kofleriaceae bacterium]
MGVLSRTLVLAALASCYSPTVKDCVLPCGSDADCAGGQACDSDGTCASPAVTCNGEVAVDAPGMVAPPDAAVAVDAPPGTVSITIEISGQGTVQLMGSGVPGMQTCDDSVGSDTSCTFAADPAKLAMANAMPKGPDQFMSWTSLVCAGQMMNCMFTPFGPTTISVLFAKKM